MNILQLSDAYLTDPDSPFNSTVKPLRHVTREGYRRLIGRLVKEMGDRELDGLGTRDLLHAHAEWIAGDRVAMAHSLATMLRILIGFGATILEDAQCQRIKGLLSGLRFQNSRPRTAWINAKQAEAIRDVATRHNHFGIALAQAFQFDCALRQKDVIGEWLPISDPTPSAIVSADGSEKWVRGITREEVDTDMVLTHKTSKRGQVLSFPLGKCPSIEEEWFSAPASGPLILDDETGLPYEAWKFRREWRRLATEAGVPKNVWNMDSRSGRITMILASGATLEDARKLAGHENQNTTSRYSRGIHDAINRSLEAALKDGKTYQEYAKAQWNHEE